MYKTRLPRLVLVVAIITSIVILPWLTAGAVHPSVGEARTGIGNGVSTDDTESPFDVATQDASVKRPVSLSVDVPHGDGFEGHLVRSLQSFDLPIVMLLAEYSRYDDSDPLENDVRQQVYEAITRSPGTYSMELADTTRISRSTIRYHVRILEEEELIFSEKIRGKQRYFPRESVNAELSAALKDDATGAVLDAIKRLEPVSVSRLASDLDRAPSTISYHLDGLTDAGLVEQERDHGTVLNRLSVQTQRELRQRADSVDVAELDSPARSYGSSG